MHAGPDALRRRADVLEAECDLVRDPPEDDLVLRILEERRDASGKLGRARAPGVAAVDLDRLLHAAGFARRSVLAVGLATRLVPTLERDAAGLVEALRGRGVEVNGVRGRARLLSPLVAGSLERSLNLAEAMEARGFGRQGRTRAPSPSWTRLDRMAMATAILVALAAIWA